MSNTDPAVIGMQSCGCITYAHARPDRIEGSFADELVRIVLDGGQVLRTTVGEAKAMPNFLVSECPHDPKGWERDADADARSLVDSADPVHDRGLVRELEAAESTVRTLEHRLDEMCSAIDDADRGVIDLDELRRLAQRYQARV